MEQPYYAKSPDSSGHQETNREHIEKVADLAEVYGAEIDKAMEARLCAQLHDFGKYSQRFQDVLKGTRTGIDHAICGAVALCGLSKQSCSPAFGPLMEVIHGHHDGLLSFSSLKDYIKASLSAPVPITCASGKEAALAGQEEYRQALQAFFNDFPSFSIPTLPNTTSYGKDENVEKMLSTRMLFSCLVDADYSASAGIMKREERPLDPGTLLDRLEEYRSGLKANSTSNEDLNHLRDLVYDRCGAAGELPPGLFTLTAPTGTGKTLALLHFALRHCLANHKRRIILVLPFLTLTEQSEQVYQNIIPEILTDHSQSKLKEELRELTARWDAPFIITTSVKFFEALFSHRPTDCRKLHSIANSVILFDEAQSLPPQLIVSTLRAVKALCDEYGCSMVFSTATQPDFDALSQLSWKPTEILPNTSDLYDILRRTRVQWRLGCRTPLSDIAEEMTQHESVCAVVNLRRHARKLYQGLKARCTDHASLYFLTTDLCPAHRSQVIETIKRRLRERLPCRVVATQCIEAGVDLDFARLYRALAPLESIIQAAGRCNRNGTLPEGGVVTVFEPADSGDIYPGALYREAAITVKGMLEHGDVDIHDPQCIVDYYRRILADSSDKRELISALKEENYAGVEEAYQFIPKQGVQVIVPWDREEALYREVCIQARTTGMTAALMRKAAPITVSTFDESRAALHGEPIFFQKRHEKSMPSGYYVLLMGHQSCYTTDMGLQFQELEPEDFMP